MNHNKILRGLITAFALLCLLQLGALAQSQSQPSSSSDDAAQSSQTKPKKAAKHSSQATQSAGQSAQAGAQAGGLNPADHKFVTHAANGGMAEVELGQLATQKAQSDDVKKFGQRMVDDHGKANQQLQQIAGQKGVTLPTSLNKKYQGEKDRLSKLSGEQFDKAYMRFMVKDHRNDVAEFQRQASTGHDQDVKNFASQTLPTLQDHLKQAKSLAPKEKQEAKTEKQTEKKGAQPPQ